MIARNSTEVYKGQPIDPRTIGRNLNVRYVFEGSVQLDGEQIRVTAQLIDAATDMHVWSKQWYARLKTCSQCKPRSGSRLSPKWS